MPAAAVIPAPKAYIKVVAVKKLVVGGGSEAVLFARLAQAGGVEYIRPLLGVNPVLCDLVRAGWGPVYCEEIRVFQAGV